MALHPNLTDLADCIAIPQLPIVYATGYDVVLTVFEDDATQARKVSDTKHQEITLIYACQSDAEKASFEAFFDARKGPFSLFYFTDVRRGISDILVRFKDGKVKYSADSVRTWSWPVVLIVVIS